MATNDLRGFGKRMRVLGGNVENNAGRIVRQVALVVDGAVVLATPVDTGRARSNWQVEIDGPAEGVVGAYVPGTEQSTAGQNAQAAIAQGQAEIAKHRNGQSIHITNNLPYIGRLNDGYSAQAPNAFVETAIMQGVDSVRGASILVDGGKPL